MVAGLFMQSYVRCVLAHEVPLTVIQV